MLMQLVGDQRRSIGSFSLCECCFVSYLHVCLCVSVCQCVMVGQVPMQLVVDQQRSTESFLLCECCCCGFVLYFLLKDADCYVQRCDVFHMLHTHRWLSTVYMVLARMGAVFPNPRKGYAWAGEDPMQAIGLDKFVEVRIAPIMPITLLHYDNWPLCVVREKRNRSSSF